MKEGTAVVRRNSVKTGVLSFSRALGPGANAGVFLRDIGGKETRKSRAHF
jgi:hypothetical protein